MLYYLPQSFLNSYSRDFFSGQSRAQLRKQPGISISASGNHQSVTVCFPTHTQTVFSRKNIPITEHRNPHRLFHLADDIPVRFPHIELIPGPAMNSHCRNTRGFGNPGNFHSVPVCLIPAGTKLYRNGNSYSFDHSYQKAFAHTSITIGVYNVTGRKNPYSVFFQTSPSGTVNV